ncbi:MAG: alanine racemase [Blastocatellia bacterium]
MNETAEEVNDPAGQDSRNQTFPIPNSELPIPIFPIPNSALPIPIFPVSQSAIPIPATRPTWAEVSISRLVDNCRLIRRHAGPGAQLMAVVKADAYGHGAIACAQALELADDGKLVNWFATALIEEAVTLRQAGIRKPILCLGGVWQGSAEAVLAHDLTPAVYDLETALALESHAAAAGRVLDVHLKVDTGMGRLGAPMSTLPELISALAQLKHVRVAGLWTHFADADADELSFTQHQIGRFEKALAQLRDAGIDPPLRHLSNSAGIHAFRAAGGNMVRAGATMYGLRRDVIGPVPAFPHGLHAVSPVLSLHSRIIHLRTVPPNTPLGYGRTFVTTQTSQIATIPVGYADGLRRALSNQGRVIVNAHAGPQYAPMVGRVSMDLTLLDVTGIPGVRTGDEVILLGAVDTLNITAEDMAAQTGTISYETLTSISARVPRIHKR